MKSYATNVEVTMELLSIQALLEAKIGDGTGKLLVKELDAIYEAMKRIKKNAKDESIKQLEKVRMNLPKFLESDPFKEADKQEAMDMIITVCKNYINNIETL